MPCPLLRRVGRGLTAAALVVASASVASAASADAPGAQLGSRPAAPVLQISNFTVSVSTAVNAAETSFPVSVHWTDGTSYTTQRLYRYDEETGVETLVEIGPGTSGVHQVADAVPFNGLTGDVYHYIVGTFVGSKFFGNVDSVSYLGDAIDDSLLSPDLTSGVWTTKQLAGATLGHYLVSSTKGATLTVGAECDAGYAFVVTTSPQGGTANLLINGSFVKKLNFKSTKVVKRVVIYRANPGGNDCVSPIQIVQLTGQINIDAIQGIQITVK